MLDPWRGPDPDAVVAVVAPVAVWGATSVVVGRVRRRTHVDEGVEDLVDVCSAGVIRTERRIQGIVDGRTDLHQTTIAQVQGQ